MSARILMLFVLSLAALGCRRTPPAPVALIEGEVIDNFGRPVRGAVAAIRDSAFRATTDERGHFSLPFAPGSFTLRIEADRCTPFTRDLQVTQAVRYPLGTKMLYRIPDEPPSAGLVVTTEGYRTLERQTLARTRTRGWTQGRMQNCLEYRLQDEALPTLRGADFRAVFPLGGFDLTGVVFGLVTRDDAPDTIAPCAGRTVPVNVESVTLVGRQFLSVAGMPSGPFCLINRQRYNPLFNTTADMQAWCFRWEQDPSVRWGAVRTLPAVGQPDVDDHATNTGEPPANCPLRNGVIPCTEACYRADARWPAPDDPAAFFASERESGECYAP